MAKSYRHLAYERRCQVYILKQRGDFCSEIERSLKVHLSTIMPELKRNSQGDIYHCKIADQKAQDLRKESHCRKMTQDMILVIRPRKILEFET